MRVFSALTSVERLSLFTHVQPILALVLVRFARLTDLPLSPLHSQSLESDTSAPIVVLTDRERGTVLGRAAVQPLAFEFGVHHFVSASARVHCHSMWAYDYDLAQVQSARARLLQSRSYMSTIIAVCALSREEKRDCIIQLVFVCVMVAQSKPVGYWKLNDAKGSQCAKNLGTSISLATNAEYRGGVEAEVPCTIDNGGSRFNVSFCSRFKKSELIELMTSSLASVH